MVTLNFKPEVEIWQFSACTIKIMHIHTHTHTHTIVLLLFWNLSGTTWVSRYQKGKNQEGKTNLDLLEQEIVSGSGICWAILSLHLIPDNHANIPPLKLCNIILLIDKWLKFLRPMAYLLTINCNF